MPEPDPHDRLLTWSNRLRSAAWPVLNSAPHSPVFQDERGNTRTIDHLLLAWRTTPPGSHHYDPADLPNITPKSPDANQPPLKALSVASGFFS